QAITQGSAASHGTGRAPAGVTRRKMPWTAAATASAASPSHRRRHRRMKLAIARSRLADRARLGTKKAPEGPSRHVVGCFVLARELRERTADVDGRDDAGE